MLHLLSDQPAHPGNVNKDDDDFQRFVGFRTCDVFVSKAIQFGLLASIMLIFVVYDQLAHPDDINEDYDDFQRFLGFRTCDL